MYFIDFSESKAVDNSNGVETKDQVLRCQNAIRTSIYPTSAGADGSGVFSASNKCISAGTNASRGTAAPNPTVKDVTGKRINNDENRIIVVHTTMYQEIHNKKIPEKASLLEKFIL